MPLRITAGKVGLLISLGLCLSMSAGYNACGQNVAKNNIRFIDCFFENASPLGWKIQGDTIVKISLLPDYERDSPNRQTDHWYFRIIAEKGDRIRFIISKMMADVYNGKIAENWWNFKDDISCYISYDRKTWQAIKTTGLPGMELLVEFTMQHNEVYVVRMPPYTVTDLENFKKKISGNSLVRIINIGMTVEKRPLEIIQAGDPDAPNSVIVRARAHPWESGGNWLSQGLINAFLDSKSAEWQKRYCIYVMPMANKDGVARGMTRFNISGRDLNRNWDVSPDSVLSPENFALERFIKGLISSGKKPSLAIDIHNDDAGGINLASHKKDDYKFIENMKLFETLMRKYTSFSENVRYSWKRDGQSEANVSIENGLTERYGIEAMVYELNANWIGSLKKMPSEYDWMKTGENLNKVFSEYFKNYKK
jgi:hypothetical protein